MARVGGIRVFSVATLLFLVLLLATTSEEMGPQVTEARTCESQSHRFKGRCFSDHNCASVCLSERFTGGKCRGLRGRCFCTSHC